VRFSIWPHLQQPWSDVVEVARHADTTSWDGVWVADHFMGNQGGVDAVDSPTLESTAALAALATATTNVRLGPLVLGSTYRHPAVVANWAASVDRISGGRLVLGLGAGWQENEHAQYGIDLPAPRSRVDRFAEVCQVVTSLLGDTRTTFDGEWFHLDEALCEPKPEGHLPLLIGASGNRMLGLVARYGDEWNLWGMPETVAERGAELDRRCDKIGRDPASIKRSTQALVMLTDDTERARQFLAAVGPMAAVAGPAERLIEVVGQWQDAGVDEVIVPDRVLGSGSRRLERMSEIIERVAPEFRSPNGSEPGAGPG
jgi:alkanesulfonate monooxygenase SsuD/methylene tetrahydromethanopterin reductase-like flavin-dependent oxidoreductase (luciferase family)